MLNSKIKCSGMLVLTPRQQKTVEPPLEDLDKIR